MTSIRISIAVVACVAGAAWTFSLAQAPTRPVEASDIPGASGYATLHSVAGNRTTIVGCRATTSPEEIECSFSEIAYAVMGPNSSLEGMIALRRQLAEQNVANARRSREGLARETARVRSEASHACAMATADPTYSAERRAAIAADNPVTRRGALACRLAASCTDVDCVRTWDSDISTFEPDPNVVACTVSSRSWTERFRRTSPGVFVHVTEEAYCGIETTSRIESLRRAGEASDTRPFVRLVRSSRPLGSAAAATRCAETQLVRFPLGREDVSSTEVPGVIAPRCDRMLLTPHLTLPFSADTVTAPPPAPSGPLLGAHVDDSRSVVPPSPAPATSPSGTRSGTPRPNARR